MYATVQMWRQIGSRSENARAVRAHIYVHMHVHLHAWILIRMQKRAQLHAMYTQIYHNNKNARTHAPLTKQARALKRKNNQIRKNRIVPGTLLAIES